MNTKSYAVEVAESAVNGFARQARGDIPSPDGSESARLFTAKGGSAVTLAAGTTSAAVVFDPEATLRNGQLNVVVYERDSADKCTKAKHVNLGRPSDEFLSVGVLSSGVKVFNSSGVDVIGGTQTSAVLHSAPKVISTISTTDLGNFVPNHERDLVQGVVSREDATMSLALTEHFGAKRCLSRTDMLSNVVTRTWDDGIGSRRTTSGETLGFGADTELGIVSELLTSAEVALAIATPGADITIGGGATKRVLADSSRLTAVNNPLTFATYNVGIVGSVEFKDANSTDADSDHIFTIIALDASDTIINTVETTERVPVTDDVPFQCRVAGTITSSTVPIARVVVLLSFTKAELANNLTDSARTTFSLTAIEESSDISARAIHVTVLEGLNASATLNINSFAVLSGIPDSSNVFISPSSSGVSEVYDTNAVGMFLQSVSRVMPRAFTVGGHGSFTKTLSALYSNESVDIAFTAMSFKDLASGVKKAASMAKLTGEELARALQDLAPLARGASMLPGPVGQIGSAVMAGVDLSKQMSRR